MNLKPKRTNMEEGERIRTPHLREVGTPYIENMNTIVSFFSAGFVLICAVDFIICAGISFGKH